MSRNAERPSTLLRAVSLSNGRMQNAECRNAKLILSSTPFLRALRSLRGECSGLSLVEILIAMFIFLVGVLGVLSLFPVAMHSAGKTIGDVRANNLAQSALAQLTADCRVVMERGYVGNNPVGPTFDMELLRPTGNVTDYTGCYVTLISKDGGYQQSRRINSVTAELLLLDTVNPAPWNPTALPHYDADPALCDTYVITRLGLPDSPILTALHQYGLNRDFAVRSFKGSNGIHVGIADGGTGTSEVKPFVNTKGTASSSGSNVLWDVFTMWGGNKFNNYLIRIANDPGALQVRRIINNGNDYVTVAPPWSTTPSAPAFGSEYEIGWPQNAAHTFITEIASGTADDQPPPPPVYEDSLFDSAMPWGVTDIVGQYLTIVSGAGAGQCRLIRGTAGSQIMVAPAFEAQPDDTSSYRIARSGGFVMFTSGRASGRVLPIAWDEGSSWACVPAVATGVGANTISASATWTDDQYIGCYVRIMDGAGVGQVRRIIDNTPTQITVDTNWVTAPSNGDSFDIMPPGTLLYLAGADFNDFGVTGAENGPNYQLQDATTFLVLGNAVNIGMESQITTVLPRPVPPGADPTIAPTGDPLVDYAYDYDTEINTLGNVLKSQVLPDVYYNTAGNELYGSEYSTVAIFSDSGTNPNGPVRVDVLVFRNYDNAKTLAENVRPVGFLTGYIQRP